MSEKEKKPTIKWLEKFKNIKHIEIYVAIIFIVILLLIYLSNSGAKETKNTKTNDSTVTSYINNIERDLEDSLSCIAGISDVKVMITINLNDLKVENSNVSMAKFPEIKGVLITAKGVNSTANKMRVLHAVQAVLDVTNGNIEILSSE